MSQPFHRWLQGWFWHHNQLVRRPLRALRTRASLLRHRLKSRNRPDAPIRVVPQVGLSVPPVSHPAILAMPASKDTDGSALDAFLLGQTETSICCAAAPASTSAAFCWQAGEDLDVLPPNHLEALLLAAAAEDLPLTFAGWSAPSASWQIDAQTVHDAGEAGRLVRMPRTGVDEKSSILARVLPHITGDDVPDAQPVSPPISQASGPYLLRGDVPPGRIVRSAVTAIDERLARLPEVPGLPTALFVLPFLAIGGAERLLFDLLAGWTDRYRALVVTLEPHRSELGQTVDRCRRLTPHLYTLGDWLPREAQLGALAYLIRRYRVKTLVSWNGTVGFYDHAPALRRRFPNLRIVDQLYNHRGGWIEHYSPRLRRAIDRHIAVNSRIAEALKHERAIASDRISTVYHGVDVPSVVDEPRRQEERTASRRALGLPEDAILVGTFIRLHAQKRPLDILSLARRFTDRSVHFLLAGGGPLDEAVDRELAERPIANLTRLPLQRDVEPLYRAIDLGLMTSSYEGLPVFLLDALARAIPCVATAVGDIPLLFQNNGGELVKRPGDIDALEKAITKLLDPSVRRQAGERGRQTVIEQFGLERYRREYEAVIFV